MQHAIQAPLHKSQVKLPSIVFVTQPAANRSIGEIDVSDLSSRVHAGICAASHGELRNVIGAGELIERRLDFTLHSAQSRLFCPAVKVGSVIRDIETEPNAFTGSIDFAHWLPF